MKSSGAKKIAFFIGFLVVLVFSPSFSLSGNPFTSSQGSYLQWNNDRQTYQLDPGALGNLDTTIVRQLVIRAFEEWSHVEYSTFAWNYGGFLDEDVTVDNMDRFLQNTIDDINPVIFDEDGSILDALVGNGASDVLLGYAVPNASPTGMILSSEVILNGKLLKDESDIQRLYATVLHEIGHFTGLDHTQLFPEFAFDDEPGNDLFLPVMFPLEPKNLENPLGLTADDKMTIAMLYKSDHFYDELGSILGLVVRPNGVAVQGANVVAVNVDQPYVTAYSTISDLNQQQRGEYTLDGLQPGRYEVYIEPIDSRFVGYSGVGPFTDTATSPSFINPVEKDYYNGLNESGSPSIDNPAEKVIIELGAGEVVNNIHFISNDESSSVREWALY